MNNRSVFFIHLLDDFSGSPKVLSQVLDSVKNSKVNIEVFTGGDSKGFINRTWPQTRRFFYHRSNNKVITLITYLLSQVHLFFKLFFLIGNSKKDSLVVVNTLLPFGGALAAKCRGLKVVYYIHETSISPRLLKSVLLFFARILSNKNIFVSNALSNDLKCLSDTDNVVIHNSTSIEYERVLKQDVSFKLKWQLRNVIMLCSLKDYKGIPEFLNLANVLPDFKFILIANDTEINAKHYLSNYPLPINFEYSCRPDNLLEFYKSAFLVVNLSDRLKWIETFGLTLLEAMSSYTPVICPVVGGPVEVVRDNVDGFHIDSSDTVKLRNAIEMLGQDFSRWEIIAINAKEQSRSFSSSEFNRIVNIELDFKKGVR